MTKGVDSWSSLTPPLAKDRTFQFFGPPFLLQKSGHVKKSFILKCISSLNQLIPLSPSFSLPTVGGQRGRLWQNSDSPNWKNSKHTNKTQKQKQWQSELEKHKTHKLNTKSKNSDSPKLGGKNYKSHIFLKQTCITVRTFTLKYWVNG